MVVRPKGNRFRTGEPYAYLPASLPLAWLSVFRGVPSQSVLGIDMSASSSLRSNPRAWRFVGQREGGRDELRRLLD